MGMITFLSQCPKAAVLMETCDRRTAPGARRRASATLRSLDPREVSGYDTLAGAVYPRSRGPRV